MNHSVNGENTSRYQQYRSDRFILTREFVTDVRRRIAKDSHSRNETVNIWDTEIQKQRKYKQYLDEVFGLRARRPEDKFRLKPWPCAPRKKGYMSSANCILDLPTYNDATFPEILDWSAKNILLASVGVTYYKFNWEAQAVLGCGMTQFQINCCKFDPDGSLLLIGTHEQFMELHDPETSKKVASNYCRCITKCDITAIDWSPTGNSFVTGCSRGMVRRFDSRCLYRSHFQKQSNASAILSLRISPNARYVAVVVLLNPSVYLLVWPSLQYYTYLDCGWNVRSIAWHPWRSALLGVGIIGAISTIAILDNTSGRISTVELGPYTKNALDVMLFSHRTGELVFSVWNSELGVSTTKSCSQLVVMSNDYTIVDQTGVRRNGIDQVRTMVFSPDGTKLAIATADEDLIFWNFLPESKKGTGAYLKSRRFSNIPVILDKFNSGHVLR